ncbi:MAG: Farnesyl diphosphate synthase [Firmicutes bacterium ADurb.Bin419]|nr:MAG: Farnesyl diphosphate synthase [Firmicutes bacterium ADurb.Bin419]
MIAGQVIDTESENKEISYKTLEYMHRCKTGALIKAPVLASAIICKASDEDYASLEGYADNLGLAFQIKDDILDVEGNAEILGKKVGSDESNSKTTYVSRYGIEKSKQLLNETTQKAIKNIERFGSDAVFLKELAEYLIVREI